MAGSGAGKGQTAKPTNALLLLALHAALLHTAAAGKNFRCPQGTPHKPTPMRYEERERGAKLDFWRQPLCIPKNNEKLSCCKWYSRSNTYACAHGNACNEQNVCVPNNEKHCCVKVDSEEFAFGGFDLTETICPRIKTAIDCPQRMKGEVLWKIQETTKKRYPLHLSCCKYNAHGDREYTTGYSEDNWDETDAWEKPKSSKILKHDTCKAGDCVPGDGKRCCAKPDGSGGFVKRPECPIVHWPQCPIGTIGPAVPIRTTISVPHKDCPTGCCFYDGNTKKFSCRKSTKGQCPQEGPNHCTGKKAGSSTPPHCCPKENGGFVANGKTCCWNKFKDGFLEVEGECPDVGCPTEVAWQPSREDSTKARGNSAWKRGDCCVKDGHETSKWARGSQCKASAVKKGDACIPKANQKCCFHTEGKKLTAVEFTADCESPTKPKCPKGDGRGKPASCETGCCVYFYATKKFGCAPKGPDGQCPPAKEKEQTCTAGRGKNDACCAAVKNGKIVGGFDSENAGKCASPMIKCGKAAGAEPEPCADGTFKCCVGNQCSKDCSAAEDRGKGDKCTPGNTVEYFRKCCVNEYGDGYVKLPNGEACPEKRAPFGCPLEVAEEPETKTCGRVRGQCCVLEGPGKANCASGDRCEDQGEICQPDSDHKCCLSPNGKALLIRKKADPCPAKPPLQCKDRKAAKIAECEEKEAEKEACKKVVEECFVDEGVSEAGAAGGKDCEEAWAECERSQTGAAEAQGPSLRLLAPATLLLLLPN